MNYAWMKLWPECIRCREFVGYEADSDSARHSNKIAVDSTIIDDIVTIEQSMKLEINADYIEELLEDHSIELTAEELEHLQSEQEEKLTDKIE